MIAVYNCERSLFTGHYLQVIILIITYWSTLNFSQLLCWKYWLFRCVIYLQLHRICYKSVFNLFYVNSTGITWTMLTRQFYFNIEMYILVHVLPTEAHLQTDFHYLLY